VDGDYLVSERLYFKEDKGRVSVTAVKTNATKPNPTKPKLSTDKSNSVTNKAVYSKHSNRDNISSAKGEANKRKREEIEKIDKSKEDKEPKQTLATRSSKMDSTNASLKANVNTDANALTHDYEASFEVLDNSFLKIMKERAKKT
jgi:hypothetical protein